jgi:hypothetical protein
MKGYKIELPKRNETANMTSYHDDDLYATANELESILGPSDGPGDKTNYEWVAVLKNEETGERNVFTVYDWKNYGGLDADQKEYFHIGGKDGRITAKAKSVLRDMLYTK